MDNHTTIQRMGFFQRAGKIVTYLYSAIGQQPYHHQLARTPQARRTGGVRHAAADEQFVIKIKPARQFWEKPLTRRVNSLRTEPYLPAVRHATDEYLTLGELHMDRVIDTYLGVGGARAAA